MILDIQQLTRRFGTVLANDSVSLQVRAGQLSGLLGHNGAGKTTSYPRSSDCSAQTPAPYMWPA